MTKRKSPVKHKVKSHVREGKRVNSYVRGHGTQSKPYTKKRLVRHDGSSRKTMEDYKIIFYYSNKRKETVLVAARDSDDALNIALKRRKMKSLKPIKIMVIDSFGSVLGSVFGKVAGGIQSAAAAYRAERAKGAPEREVLKQVREMKESERAELREDFASKQLTRAKSGDRAAQIWSEKHNIGWESV